MIRCLCLNPSLDKTVSVPEFLPDAPNRVTPVRADVSGKGVNVAQAVLALGGAARLYAFDFRNAPLARKAREAGIPCTLIPTGEELRTNLKVWDEKARRTIEINEPGAKTAPERLEALLSAFLADCGAGDWAVLSGSIPPGVPTNVYRELCLALREKGCRVAADCDGEALRAVLTAGPDLIKPNEEEFARLTGLRGGDIGSLARACMKRNTRVCLSLGPRGALLAGGESAFFCPAADVRVRSLQGAGDSMLAGLLTALEGGQSDSEALAFASAAAGASIALPGTLLCGREDAEALFPPLYAAIRPVSTK